MDEMIEWLRKRLRILAGATTPVWQGALAETKRALAEAERIEKRQARRKRKAA